MIRERFCESREGVRLPSKGPDLRGSPRNFRGSPGKFRGSLGNFRGTPGLLVSSTVRELPGKSPKNFRGSLGNFRGSPGTFQKLGESDSLPATRQICLQNEAWTFMANGNTRLEPVHNNYFGSQIPLMRVPAFWSECMTPEQFHTGICGFTAKKISLDGWKNRHDLPWEQPLRPHALDCDSTPVGPAGQQVFMQVKAGSVLPSKH